MNGFFLLLHSSHMTAIADVVLPLRPKRIFGQTFLLPYLTDANKRVNEQTLRWFFRSKEAFDECVDMFIPIHLVCHWILGTINFITYSMEVYDSLNKDNEETLSKLQLYAASVSKLYYPQGRPGSETRRWSVSQVM
jgi:hypothetical protein